MPEQQLTDAAQRMLFVVVAAAAAAAELLSLAMHSPNDANAAFQSSAIL